MVSSPWYQRTNHESPTFGGWQHPCQFGHWDLGLTFQFAQSHTRATAYDCILCRLPVILYLQWMMKINTFCFVGDRNAYRHNNHNAQQSHFPTTTTLYLTRHRISQLSVTYIAYMTVTNRYRINSKVKMSYNHGVRCGRSVIGTNGYIPGPPQAWSWGLTVYTAYGDT
jgi:hypothetical protein